MGRTENQLEWLKGLRDTCPANEAKGQTTASASRMELLESGRRSETFTTRDVDVDL